MPVQYAGWLQNMPMLSLKSGAITWGVVLGECFFGLFTTLAILYFPRVGVKIAIVLLTAGLK
jgi:hypothetical protein